MHMVEEYMRETCSRHCLGRDREGCSCQEDLKENRSRKRNSSQLVNSLVQRYKILNGKQIEKLEEFFRSSGSIRTQRDCTKVAKKLGIPSKKVIEYMEMRIGQHISILEDFYNNAHATLRIIQLDNEYAMIKYKRLDKYFREQLGAENMREFGTTGNDDGR